ncbi:hypothetical protein PspLS_09860 [Pyricularia sp. CBS 133598]|nr:hypothetical protein PspLS_09860 [Pyricularia sp. CBS 133598]
MRILHNGPLALLLNLLCSSNQQAHRTSLLLPLSGNDNTLALLQLPTPVAIIIHLITRLALDERQPASLAGQTRRHKCGTTENKANGSPIDADGREGLGEAMDEPEVRQDGGAARGEVVLEADGLAVDDVEHDAVRVRELHLLERRLLGQYLVDKGRQERVPVQQLLADGALGRGFYFLLRRSG